MVALPIPAAVLPIGVVAVDSEASVVVAEADLEAAASVDLAGVVLAVAVPAAVGKRLILTSSLSVTPGVQ